jgi:hypothetical protein
MACTTDAVLLTNALIASSSDVVVVVVVVFVCPSTWCKRVTVSLIDARILCSSLIAAGIALEVLVSDDTAGALVGGTATKELSVVVVVNVTDVSVVGGSSPGTGAGSGAKPRR